MKHLLKVRQVFSRSLICLVPLVSLASHAAPLQPVPPGLNPGDEYRLVFVTQGWNDELSSHATDEGTSSRTALPTDIAVYNAWVTDRALYQPELLALGTTWSAIASTTGIDARDNTGTNPTVSVGVPIYMLDGQRIAADNADLWDGALERPLSFNERGYNNNFSGVWTGTLITGIASPLLELGASSGYSGVGKTQNANSSWIVDTDHPGFNSPHENQNFRRMYVMSDVLTVQAASAVPVPAAAWLFASAVGVLAGTTKRRR